MDAIGFKPNRIMPVIGFPRNPFSVQKTFEKLIGMTPSYKAFSQLGGGGIARGSSFNCGESISKKWTLLNPLGRGGMAEVWLANDLSNNQVAIKFLDLNIFSAALDDEEAQEHLDRFKREHQITQPLKNPRIVETFEAGQMIKNRQIQPYLVMEYVPWPTLENLIAQSYFDSKKAVDVMVEILTGAEFVQSMQICHRDLKSSNIFVSPTHQIKIGDFGIASGINFQQVTQKVGIGTIGHVVPQQGMPGNVDPSLDVYALGVTFFMMLHNLNIDFNKQKSIYLVDLLNDPANPIKFSSNIKKSRKEFILKAISLDANIRFPNASAMLKELQKIEGITILASPQSTSLMANNVPTHSSAPAQKSQTQILLEINKVDKLVNKTTEMEHFEGNYDQGSYAGGAYSCHIYDKDDRKRFIKEIGSYDGEIALNALAEVFKHYKSENDREMINLIINTINLVSQKMTKEELIALIQSPIYSPIKHILQQHI